MHYVSLCFNNQELEEQYQNYQFELCRHSVLGKLGYISLTTMGAGAIMAISSAHELMEYFITGSTGCIKAVLYSIPIIAFSMNHQFRVQRGVGNTKDDKGMCNSFVVAFVGLYALSEFSLTINVDDFFPDHQGCAVHRFRCPYSFSSAHASAQAVVFLSLLIFHVTPCVSFVRVVQLVIVLFFSTRSYGLYAHREEITTSIWSTACVFMQLVMFLGCRYMQELHNREQFLLQIHIVRLRSNLQDVLDNMMPRSISRQARTGEPVIVPFDNAIVLLCSFPADESPEDDMMKSFQLLDMVHQAFDDLVSQCEPRPFKVDFIGNDYILTSPMLESLDESGAPSQPAFDSKLCDSLGRLAAQMRRAADRILAGTGMELRISLSAGPVFAVVIGETRRYLRLIGEGVNTARRLCELAGPGQVLTAGRAAATLRSAGLPMRELGPMRLGAASEESEVFEIGRGAAGSEAAPADGAALRADGQQVLSCLSELSPAAAALPGPSLREALADLAEAEGSLAPGGDAALSDPTEESRFRLEADAHLYSGSAAAARTACVAACHVLYLAGLPAAPSHGIREPATSTALDWEIWLRAGLVMASLGAAGLQRLFRGDASAQRALWAGMHSVFACGCMALAHARAEPFLILGFSLGAGLCYVAPPCASATAARRWLGAAYGGLLAVLEAASRRDGLTGASLPAVLSPVLLIACLGGWLRGEGRASRVVWLLDGRRKRERAALWAALRDLVPEHVLERLGPGSRIEPHVVQLVVLHADAGNPLNYWAAAAANTADAGATAARAKGGGGRAVVERMHALLASFDREVLNPAPPWFGPPRQSPLQGRPRQSPPVARPIRLSFLSPSLPQAD